MRKVEIRYFRKEDTQQKYFKRFCRITGKVHIKNHGKIAAWDHLGDKILKWLTIKESQKQDYDILLQSWWVWTIMKIFWNINEILSHNFLFILNLSLTM